jgi:hypothetical protein
MGATPLPPTTEEIVSPSSRARSSTSSQPRPQRRHALRRTPSPGDRSVAFVTHLTPRSPTTAVASSACSAVGDPPAAMVPSTSPSGGRSPAMPLGSNSTPHTTFSHSMSRTRTPGRHGGAALHRRCGSPWPPPQPHPLGGQARGEGAAVGRRPRREARQGQRSLPAWLAALLLLSGVVSHLLRTVGPAVL